MARRRGNHEGSVFPRKDGRWVGAITTGGGRTRQQRRYVYGKTREEAARKLQELQHRARTGTLPTDGRLTFRELCEQWLREKRTQVMPNTMIAYEASVTSRIIPALGHFKLNKMSPAHVSKFASDLADEGLSRTTQHDYVARVRSILLRGQRLGWTDRNVAALVPLPRKETTVLPVVSEDEFRQMVSATKGLRLGALFLLAITVGPRQSELLGLRWDDIDWEASELNIWRKLRPVSGGGFELDEPPKRDSKRRVSLTRPALEALRRHRDQQAFEAKALGSAWNNPWNLIFTNRAGGPIHKDNISKGDFREWLKSAEIDKHLTFHSTRHIAASLMLGRGVPVPIVSATLGHKDQATTLRVYSHVIPGQNRLAAEAMEAALAG